MRTRAKNKAVPVAACDVENVLPTLQASGTTQGSTVTTQRSKRKMNKNSNSSKSHDTQHKRSRLITQTKKPTVINLDVSYSSSDSDCSSYSDMEATKSPMISIENENNKQKSVNNKAVSHIESSWPSLPMKNGRTTLYSSDSDSDLDGPSHLPSHAPQRDNNNENRDNICDSDDDDNDDIYGINYEADRQDALLLARNEFREMRNKSLESKLVSSSSLNDENTRPSSNRLKGGSKSTISRSLSQDSFEEVGNQTQSDNFSDLDIELEDINFSPVDFRNYSGGKRRNKKTKKALESLQAFMKRNNGDVQCFDTSLEDTCDTSDIILMDDDLNHEFFFRIRWGATYLRHTISKSAKFVDLYQKLAEEHKVSVSEVVLSFHDAIISPHQRPVDVGLGIGDIVEGGISRSGGKDNKSDIITPENPDKTSLSASTDKDSISLKVQTTNRKVVHNLSINKYDKLSILMGKYAALRSIPIGKLRFKFDGETIAPSDTPESLDLEGDECIDVYEL